MAQPPDGTDVVSVNRWPMERVQLLNGREYFGLVRRQDRYILELVEIKHPVGKPMHLLVRPIDQGKVFLVERLNSDERRKLDAKVEEFRNRTRIMATRMESIRLDRLGSDARRFWRYEGPWFQFDSTADEETTRRAVIRLEQVFAGYRAFLKPTRAPSAPLRIVLLGSMEEYRDVARRKLTTEIKNPAFFLPRDNVIIAGSDLARFSGEWKRTQQHHERLLKRQQELSEEVEQRMASLSENLKAVGTPDNKRRQVLRAAEVQAEEEQRRLRRDITTAERRNRDLFEEKSNAMFVRLAHEAFHAYLENYVYDARRHDVPRWLNEGLAQVFEAGILEADTLRLDAPNAAALTALQADLKTGQPLALAELLTSSDDAFLAGHASGIEAANRRYYYSWGVAHYLTFELQLLGSTRLNAYMAKTEKPRDPIRGLEQLVGSRLPDFETRWRNHMLTLK